MRACDVVASCFKLAICNSDKNTPTIVRLTFGGKIFFLFFLFSICLFLLFFFLCFFFEVGHDPTREM